MSSNLSDHLRLLIDLLQMPPPVVASSKPTRDPDHPPSPKPLFGTRPPPAALALARGFSTGHRSEPSGDAPRPTSPSSPSTAGGSTYSAAADSPFAHLRQRRDGPLCSGWLSMQKNAGKWKRYWCEYAADGVLSYRVDDTTKKPIGTIQVTYCEAELTQLPAAQLSAARKPTVDPEQQIGACRRGAPMRSGRRMPGCHPSNDLPPLLNSPSPLLSSVSLCQSTAWHLSLSIAPPLRRSLAPRPPLRSLRSRPPPALLAASSRPRPIFPRTSSPRLSLR